ncbi:PaaI family thioesterase [Rubrobacter indicoceani]|uniref:PaaI family thioesterase n=1 Tax=Rubrobacter indicoceani TaxID=2051957 RepID=UPI0013C4C19C|nr:PaaI family thioesterase [Rubrobacter indicoceani]
MNEDRTELRPDGPPTGERNWSRIDWNELDFLKWPGLELLGARGGCSEMVLHVEEHHRGGGGHPLSINGGIVSYMFDALLGAAVASTWDDETVGQVTITLTTQFTGQITAANELRGEANVTRRGGSTVFVEGRILSEDGSVGAFCTGIFKLFRKR